MVHADALTFATDLSKREIYTQILAESASLFTDQRNWVSNTSNTSSLLYHALLSLPPPSNAVNWAGFYVVYPSAPKVLQLGPFQGHVACQTIQYGRGVCGTAAQDKVTQVVSDVHKFPGHIACDAKSRSEIVVPVLKDGSVVAVIDIDCAEVDGFDAEDQYYLEQLADLLAKASDWPVKEPDKQDDDGGIRYEDGFPVRRS